MGDPLEGVNAIFYMGLATLAFGSIAMCFRMCYKSKCSEINCGCLKIKRDVNVENPYRWAEDPNFLKYVKLESVCHKTLVHWQAILVKQIEREVSLSVRGGVPNGKVVPLVLLIDCWDNAAGEKLLGAFIAVPDKTDSKLCHYALLSCHKLDDESNSKAQNQYNSITTALKRIKLEWDDVLVFIADNTNVNPAIAKLGNRVMIGCKAHLLALAVKKYLAPYQVILDKVHGMCTKMRDPNFRGLLKEQGCNLTPFIRGHKWDATFAMVERYLQIQEAVIVVANSTATNRAALEKYRLTTQEEIELGMIRECLSKFHAVTNAIQSRSIDIASVFCLFNKLREDNPGAEREGKFKHLYLSNVENPPFESALVKVIEGREDQLDTVEEDLLMPFLVPDDDDDDDDDEDDDNDYAASIIAASKRRRIVGSSSKYIPLDWIPTSTCEVERLFSVCRHVFSDWRKSMLDTTLENAVYLRVNRGLWDINTCALALEADMDVADALDFE